MWLGGGLSDIETEGGDALNFQNESLLDFYFCTNF